jgi:hypothetical protein
MSASISEYAIVFSGYCLSLGTRLQVTRKDDDLRIIRIVSQAMSLSAGTSMHRENLRATQGALLGAARSSYMYPHPPILASSFAYPLNQFLFNPRIGQAVMIAGCVSGKGLIRC